MAKTKGKTDVSPDSVVLSTRVDTDDRELIDKAAKASGVSAAQFVRTAARERAVDIINANGASRDALRRLATIVTKQILNPEVSERWDRRTGPDIEDCETDHNRYEWTDFQDADGFQERRANLQYREHEGWSYVESSPERPSQSDLEQIEIALKTSGSVLIDMILEQWPVGQKISHEYRPIVWKDRIQKPETE